MIIRCFVNVDLSSLSADLIIEWVGLYFLRGFAVFTNGWATFTQINETYAAMFTQNLLVFSTRFYINFTSAWSYSTEVGMKHSKGCLL